MPRGSVIRDVPIVLGVADGRRRGRLDDIDNGCRQSAQAHHPAARRPRGLVMTICGGRRFVSDIRFIFVAVGLAEMRGSAGMIVHMAILMDDVLRSPRAIFMHMHDAQTVVFVGKAWRRPRPVGKRKGNARRQDAKQINQGEQPPCPESLRSGQTHEHSVLNLANQNTPYGKPTRKRFLRQA